MKQFILFFAFIAIATSAFTQKTSTIKGTVKGEDELLISASAILYFEKDSVITAFGLTDTNGEFVIPNIAPNNYYLQIDYIGYASAYKSIAKEDFTGEIDLGEIKLETDNTIEEVTITNAPLKVKKDTIVYDAEAFKVKQNATVEDLLKELPGIEVEDDGSITAQGEQVEQVLVDGKKFFGDDPTIATKNLPADAVKNVAVYDKKSEKAEFTGIDDGQEEKTIDIELKEDRKNGYFGNIEAGKGTEDFYEGKALISRFSPTLQLSTILSRNNVNDRAFSYRDYFALSGASMGSGNRVTVRANNSFNQNLSSGINTSTALGTNLTANLGENLEIYTNYIYTEAKTNFHRDIDRLYFREDGDLTYEEENYGEAVNGDHRISLDLTYSSNQKSEIKLENQFSFADKDNESYEDSFTSTTSNQLVNDNEAIQKEDGNSVTMNSNVFVKRRFAKKGRSLFLSGNLTVGDVENNQSTNSTTAFYNPTLTDLLNQQLSITDESTTLGGSIVFTEPIKENHYLELETGISNGTTDNNQNFYDLETGMPILNSVLTNDFNRDLNNQFVSALYRIIAGNHNINFGSRYNFNQLKGRISNSSESIDKNFNQFAPFVGWKWDNDDGANLNTFYSVSQTIPTINQLQPTVDNTNPLNIYKGNPNLEAATEHMLTTNYFNFNRFSFRSIFLFASIAYTNNPITNAQTFNDNLVQTTQPINTDNEIRSSVNASYSKPIRAIKARARLRTSFNHTNGQNFIDAIENDYNRISQSYSLSLDNTNNEKIDIEVNGRVSFNNTKYSKSDANNQRFVNQRYGIEAELRAIENWEIGSEFDYNIYSQEAFAQDNTLPILRASISRFLVNNKLELRLTAEDILNKNTGISRSQNLNYSEEELSNAIGRYGMFSARWNLGNGDKKGRRRH